MSAFGVYSLIKARRLSEWADMIGAMSLEAYDGRVNPFLDEVHELRPHKGQITPLAIFSRLLEGSELIRNHKEARSGSLFIPLHPPGTRRGKR